MLQQSFGTVVVSIIIWYLNRPMAYTSIIFVEYNHYGYYI